MGFDTKKDTDVTIVSITGRMDALTAPEIEGKLTELVDAGEKKLVIDLQGLSYISSAGLRSLLVTAKKLKSSQGKIVFANLQGTVMEVFRISGFYSLFAICDSVGAALGSFKEGG